MRKRFLFLLIGGILMSFANTPAFAELKLDKYRQKLTITPGETINGYITVENISNQDVTVRTSIQDMVLLPPFEGGMEFKPQGSTSYSFGAWVTVFPEVFVLSGRGKQKVKYTVKVPDGAKGGYYGTVFFEKVPFGAGTGMGVVFKIGCTLSLVTKDAVSAMKISDISFSREELDGKFLNSGNLISNCDYSYYLMDAKGVVIDKGKSLKQFILPPGEMAPLSIKLPKKINAGEYDIVVNFNLSGGGSIVKEIYFSKDNSGNLKLISVKD